MTCFLWKWEGFIATDCLYATRDKEIEDVNIFHPINENLKHPSLIKRAPSSESSSQSIFNEHEIENPAENNTRNERRSERPLTNKENENIKEVKNQLRINATENIWKIWANKIIYGK